MLMLRQDDKLVKYRGMWMTAKQARMLKLLNRDTSAIDEFPVLTTATVSRADETSTQILPKATAPKANASKFRIMNLPFDIREKILAFNTLEFVAARSPSLRIRVYLSGKYGRTSTGIHLPPVTKAGDRKLRLEAILITVKLVTLEIHNGECNGKLQNWLASLRLQGSGQTSLCTGFDAVHSLYFPYFSRYPFYALPVDAPNNHIQLMRRCEHLREVKIDFAPGTLQDENGEDKSVDQLRPDYRLDGMLDLPNLKTLTFLATSVLYADL